MLAIADRYLGGRTPPGKAGAMERRQRTIADEQLRSEMVKECESMVEGLLDVMDRTPDTNIIGGSEWGVQAVVMKSKQALFEKMIQSKARSADAGLAASFSPGERGLGPGQGQAAAEQGRP